MDSNTKDAEALIALLRRPQQWVTNAELAKALHLINYKGNKQVAWHWNDIDEVLRPGDTKLDILEGASDTHVRRFFSKRALVVAGLRSQTPAGKALRYWVADMIVQMVTEPNERISAEKIKIRELLVETFGRAVDEVLGDAGGDDHVSE